MLERTYECGPGMIAAAKAPDRAWLAILAASFGFGLAVSWHRWGNPLIDTGREMNQPLRLLGGEMLYSDIRHIYGPLSPWLHAGLFYQLEAGDLRVYENHTGCGNTLDIRRPPVLRR